MTVEDFVSFTTAMEDTMSAMMGLTWFETFPQNAFVENAEGKTTLVRFTDAQLTDIAAIFTANVASVNLADLQSFQSGMRLMMEEADGMIYEFKCSDEATDLLGMLDMGTTSMLNENNLEIVDGRLDLENFLTMTNDQSLGEDDEMPAGFMNFVEGMQIWKACPNTDKSDGASDAATTMFASMAGAYLVVTAIAF